MSEVLAALKEGTRPEHERIEGAVPLMDPRFGAGAYRRYLARLLGFYAPLEERLARHDWARLGVDIPGRRKVPLLERDLRTLGWSPEAALPGCDALPDVSEPAAALGCVYVVEGSTLGGQILTRALKARLPAELHGAFAFLDCYGERTGAMWKLFREQVEVAAARVGNERRLLQGARDTFHRLDAWLRAAPEPWL